MTALWMMLNYLMLLEMQLEMLPGGVGEHLKELLVEAERQKMKF